MIPLFYGPSGTKYSLRHSSYFYNLKDMIEKDIFRVTNYHRDSSRATSNSDYLVKFIRAVNGNVELSKFDFITFIDSRAPYIERTHGIISNYSFGRVVSILNGDGILVSTDSGIDHINIGDKWKDLAPIKPIASDTTDISIPHPTKMDPSFTGYIIDTKLLLMMWYHYANEVENPQLNYFIYRYVYTNMIPYYMDLAIINIFLGKEVKLFKNTNPISVINQTSKIERYLRPLIKKTKNKKLFYEEIMLNLKLISSRDMLEFFTLNTKYFTRQSKHGMFVLYKDITLYLILYLGDRGIRKNLYVLKDLQLLTERMQGRKDLEAIDYGMYKEDIEETLEIIYDISKNRRI